MRLIDADALEKIYQGWLSELDGNNPDHTDEGLAIYSCICHLKDAETIESETLPIVQELRRENDELKKKISESESVVHATWRTDSNRPDTLICSECEYGYDMWKHDPHNYCPHCGAKTDLDT